MTTGSGDDVVAVCAADYTPLSSAEHRGGTERSPVAHLNGVQGVAGSNPAVPIHIPTVLQKTLRHSCRSVLFWACYFVFAAAYLALMAESAAMSMSCLSKESRV